MLSIIVAKVKEVDTNAVGERVMKFEVPKGDNREHAIEAPKKRQVLFSIGRSGVLPTRSPHPGARP